jgi:hypothetical protein
MRAILVSLAATALAAAPAAAQDVIRPGQRVAGELSMADPVLENGSHYDVWRFQGRAEHLYRVTMRSNDFDAYLVVGSDIRPGCDACATGDDGAGGTNALVEFTGAEDGTYEIRANSFDEDAMGGYELVLEDKGIVAPPPPIASVPIALGQTVEGGLARGDGKDHGRGYSDTYSYQGRAGETLVITLTSTDFDAQLNFGRVNLGECMELNSDDDGGEGTNSRLTVTLAEDGEYHVHVGSSDAGGRGRYTLRVEAGTEPVEAEAAEWPITAGRSIEGRLDEGDPRADDESFYEAWTYMGGVGETLTIRMQSDDFDTYLVFGRVRGGVWEELQTNDDGPDGTDSELTVTLPENGEYVIRANSFGPGQTGRYTLRIDRD